MKINLTLPGWIGLVLLLTISCAANSQTTYTILAEDAAGHWGQADGTGAGNDIVRAAYAAVGDNVVLKIVPYNRCKTYVMNGIALACFGMSWSDELKDKVIFPREPIYSNVATIFIRKRDAQKYRKLTDVQPKSKIGTVLGYEYPQAFTDLVRSDIFVTDDAPSEVSSLKKLAAGRFDFVIANVDDLKSAAYLLKQAEVEDTVQIAFELERSKTFIGFSAARRETAAALHAFDAGMAKIKHNGTLARIQMLWNARRDAE